ILDAAEELFADRGFDATPTARVAAEAGVPKGLLFYHFARKIDLLKALFAERMPVAVPHEAGDVVVPGDVAPSLLGLADRTPVSQPRPTGRRNILGRGGDPPPGGARCVHNSHEELLQRPAGVIRLAAPDGVTAAARHAAGGAWTGTMSLALNPARL